MRHDLLEVARAPLGVGAVRFGESSHHFLNLAGLGIPLDGLNCRPAAAAHDLQERAAPGDQVLRGTAVPQLV